MANPRLQRFLNKLLPFGLIWLVFGIIFLVVEYAATKGLEGVNSGVIQIDIKVILFALPAVTLVGLMIGVIELLFVKKRFAHKPFLFKLIGKLLIYASFLFVIICLTYPLAASIELEVGVFHPTVWDKFNTYLSSIAFFSTGFQMAVSLIFTLFYHEISEKVGLNAFSNFIIGKYHKPKQERRLFMFLDMNASTTIAEKIGHGSYFDLLKAYYNVLSHGVLKYGGEVYQYVGDEMVISWKIQKGKVSDDVLQCFFKMKEDLLEKEAYFNAHFGHAPTFKAGVHCGEVTTGEIGKLKKDVIFTGDTLNTTARIQGLCNALEVDLLLSAEALQEIAMDQGYALESFGKQTLKGKEEPIDLVTVTKRDS